MPYPDRHVARPPDARPSLGDLEVEERDKPVLGLRRTTRGGLVRHQVSLAEHDDLPVDTPYRLDDVNVLADDRGDRGRAGEPARERELLGRRRVLVLGAPMQVDDHGVGTLPARGPGIGQDPARSRPVERPGVRHELPVRDSRVGEKRDPYSLDFEDREGPPPARRACGAVEWNAGPAQGPDCRVDTGLTGIERVVRGRAAYVPAGPADGPGQRGRRAEARIPHRRSGHERRLDMTDREV